MVSRISETIGEISAVNEVVHEVDVVAGDGSADEFDYTDVVATTDDGEALFKLIELEFAREFPLENDVHTCLPT